MLDAGKRLLFDYGIKLDHKTEYPIEAQKVDAAVLSHAHLDHSGFLPSLYNKMFPPVMGTAPTLELSLLLLEDSMAIAKKQHMQEHFHKRQLKSYENRFVSMGYHTSTSLADFNIELFDAGHISGSTITRVEKSGYRIVYTGDFKLAEQRLHKGAEVVKSDVLITESTYATRTHPDMRELSDNFIEKIKEVLDNGGTALIPVFAVGRSQEILTILYEHGLAGRTYLDGMARSATAIVQKHPEFIANSELLARAVSETMQIGEHGGREGALSEPSVIVTTAGMLNGGPVLDYITKLNKSSYIFLTGYQVDGTNGRMLLDEGQIIVHGLPRKITTPVSYYDFSAHADKNDLHEYIKMSEPQTVVCVHGSEESATQLAESLKLDGYEAYAPKNGDVIEIR
jgi:putative mRNA 3-end processing factor